MNIKEVKLEKRAVIEIDDGTLYRVTITPSMIEKWSEGSDFGHWIEIGYMLTDEQNRELSVAASKALLSEG